MSKVTLVCCVLAIGGLHAEQRDVLLDSGSIGSVQVRPMTATRAPIKPMGGTIMIVNSPSPVEIAILTRPTPRRAPLPSVLLLKLKPQHRPPAGFRSGLDT